MAARLFADLFYEQYLWEQEQRQKQLPAQDGTFDSRTKQDLH